MSIDENFAGSQQKLMNLILQTCQGTSRKYSDDLLNHFNCEKSKPEPKDFRKNLKQFLTKINDKYSFTSEEKEAFMTSCKVLEKENKPTCCKIF
jgi:flagellar hook-basal body complex protein FliE